MKQLVLCSNNPSDEEFYRRVADRRGVQFTKVAAPAEAMKLAEDAQSGVFVEVQDEGDLDLMAKKRQSTDPIPNLYLILPPSPPELTALALRRRLCGNVVWNRYADIEHDSEYFAAVLGIAHAGAKTLEDAFGQATKLHAQGPEEKNAVTDSICDYLMKLGCSSRVAQTVMCATDELLITAMSGQAAQTADGLSIGASAQVRLSNRKESIAVTVDDAFGRLNFDAFFNQAASAFSSQQEESAMQPSGGGVLNMAVVLRTGASLLIQSQPGHSTELSVLFNKAQRVLELKSQFRFVLSRFT